MAKLPSIPQAPGGTPAQLDLLVLTQVQCGRFSLLNLSKGWNPYFLEVGASGVLGGLGSQQVEEPYSEWLSLQPSPGHCSSAASAERLPSASIAFAFCFRDLSLCERQIVQRAVRQTDLHLLVTPQIAGMARAELI